MNLKNKKIVVTGASKGLGLGIVKRLVKEGADIIAHYNSGDIGEAQKVAEEAGVSFNAFRADLSNERETSELAEQMISCGEIYGLVNNAGVCFFEEFFDITPESYDRTFEINMKSVFFITQQITKSMVKNGVKGRVINFSSIASKAGTATQTHYGAAKGAVNSFTKSAAAALGPYGITVNAILPGPIPTKHNNLFLSDDNIRKGLFERIALNQYGEPDNIADVVVYLLGENANWTTGSLITVDGGFLCK